MPRLTCGAIAPRLPLTPNLSPYPRSSPREGATVHGPVRKEAGDCRLSSDPNETCPNETLTLPGSSGTLPDLMQAMFRILLALGLLITHRPLGAVDIVSGPWIEALTPTNAVLRWTTDVPCGARVHFGSIPSKLDRRAEGSVTNQHVVALRDLKPATPYFYTVGTARYPLATNTFQTPGAAATASATSGTPALGAAGKSEKSSWAPSPPPPARQTWGSFASLQDHFDRHGRDFNARTPEEYAAMAWQFLQRAKTEGLPMKRDADGVLRVFDPKTRAFAAYNRDGTTKTYFKPQSRDYFDRQPGTLVQRGDLR